jgi:3-oxoacyl-[acyl-carrier-protein] synthase-3
MPSKIIGTGSALPRRLVTNAELSARFGLSKAAIEKRVGVQTRYWVSAGETCSTLATAAARAALASAQMAAERVDLVIVSTTSADHTFPSTACLVQKALGARAAAFDLGGSCAGFLYALSVADQFLKNKTARVVLVIASEVKSVFLNPNDLATSILFGDGAGAVVLTEGTRGISSIRLHADGSKHRLITLPAGGSRLPTTPQTLREGRNAMQMDGPPLFRIAARKMEAALSPLIGQQTESDLFLFHQANLRLLETVVKKCHVGNTHLTIQKWGNTSSASLPMALDDARRSGKLTGINRLVLCAFGGGITWGTAVIDGPFDLSA